MKPTRRSSLFLLELMIAILLFSLSAAICIQIFVKSHTIEKKSTELNQAVFAASSIAEIIRSGEDYEDILWEEYPLTEETENVFYIYFDQVWESVSSTEASYVLTLEAKENTNFITGQITVSPVSQLDAPIYELDVKKHRAEEGTD